MFSKQKRISYTVGFNLNVIKIYKRKWIWIPKIQFGQPANQKIIHEWRRYEEGMKMCRIKNRH